IKELEDLASKKENQIKEQMKDAERLTTGGYIVNWKSITSKRLDTAALKVNEPDTYSKYVKESTSRRFEIKEA
ncbi:MAG: hypothetical protein OH363_05025, partial [Candidatus Parvarchaeota archaeon]|nr:hypothetical protein [Candidatus Jingweiarchaeum tengchongense]